MCVTRACATSIVSTSHFHFSSSSFRRSYHPKQVRAINRRPLVPISRNRGCSWQLQLWLDHKRPLREETWPLLIGLLLLQRIILHLGPHCARVLALRGCRYAVRVHDGSKHHQIMLIYADRRDHRQTAPRPCSTLVSASAQEPGGRCFIAETCSTSWTGHSSLGTSCDSSNTSRAQRPSSNRCGFKTIPWRYRIRWSSFRRATPA